ncbi:methyltransferase domain-containing protein [Mesorhizobium sp. YR577]|uniref:class I SAM-dependent methyltransferase n=1 Tax=Mesorhizobium sp. YR577 TaxID=1884373 RepID=UPI000B88DE87|nr:methyltransferase domain-containing protein [Mesorhizobium sp. YR577]
MASCNDFIALKRQYRSKYKEYGSEWSLKEYGSLLIYDFIKKNKVKRVLEFGPGFNLFFSEQLQEFGVDYWAIDDSISTLGIGPNASRANEVIAKRRANGHQHVHGLLGDKANGLPVGYFDLVFSISVVEHIDDAVMPAVVADAKRVLNASGVMLNTVDTYYGSKKHLQWHGSVRGAGMTVPLPHRLEWSFSGHHTTFLERQDVRYVIYNSIGNSDVWKTDTPYLSQFATAAHLAHL